MKLTGGSTVVYRRNWWERRRPARAGMAAKGVRKDEYLVPDGIEEGRRFYGGSKVENRGSLEKNKSARPARDIRLLVDGLLDPHRQKIS